MISIESSSDVGRPTALSQTNFKWCRATQIPHKTNIQKPPKCCVLTINPAPPAIPEAETPSWLSKLIWIKARR